MGLSQNTEYNLEALRLKGLNHRATISEMEHHAIERAIEWFRFKSYAAEEMFTEEFVKFVHKKMYGAVWKTAGSFRQSEQPKGSRWSNIAIQLRGLNSDTLENFHTKTYPSSELAVRYMHGLSAICCFENGNGVHARLMADLIVTKLFAELPLTWGRLQARHPENLRREFRACLEAADCNDYEPLIRFSRS